MKNLRKNLLGLGFGVGGGGGGGTEEAGGGGGVRGTFSIGIVVELGVAGVGGVFELNEVATGPSGGGTEVPALAEPGKITGFESAILGFLTSAKLLYIVDYCQQLFCHSIDNVEASRAHTMLPEPTRLA